MTEPTRLISRPWATVADLPANKPTLDDETWEDLLTQASELLYAWSGRQFSGESVSTVTLDTPPGADSSAHSCWRDWEAPWTPRGDRGVRDAVVARLPDSPVTAIDAVVIDDVEQQFDVDYKAELPAGLVWRTGFRSWPAAGRSRITYRHGIAPPIGGQRSAVLLAVELGKSWAGDTKCKLPKRIESITREGITIGMVSSLQGWRTGMWDIDSWLSSVNPHMMTRRASAWSPDVPRMRRTV